ncbi:hypothetical protein [Cellulomonas taurus]|nr:hypothetical protein [Cellulomonas taurus]
MRTFLAVTAAVAFGVAGAAGVIYLVMYALMIPLRVLATIVEAM